MRLITIREVRSVAAERATFETAVTARLVPLTVCMGTVSRVSLGTNRHAVHCSAVHNV